MDPRLGNVLAGSVSVPEDGHLESLTGCADGGSVEIVNRMHPVAGPTILTTLMLTACPSADEAEVDTDTIPPPTVSTSDAGVTTQPGSTGEPPACLDDWWSPAWTARARVTVDTDSLDAPLESIAIPLQLSELSELAKPDGFDLRFVGDDGLGLDWELDDWSAASGGVIWVRLEQVAPGVETGFWVYFDHPGASEGDTPAKVWAGWDAVWHLGRAVDGTLVSASEPELTGMNQGTLDMASPLALGRRFPDTADGVIAFEQQTGSLADGWTELSLSLWLSAEYPSDEAWTPGTFLSRGGSIDAGRVLRDPDAQDAGWGAVELDLSFDDGQTVTTHIEIPRAQPVWLAWDFDGDVVRTFLDGALVEEIDVTGSALASGASPLRLGAEQEAFVGLLDELRIDDQSHGTPWYAAQFRAMTFALTSLGEVQRCP